MNCPVCNSSGLAEESKKCPQCNADLEAFLLTKKIEQTGKGRLVFGWIASILFIIALVALIVFFVITPKEDQPTKQETQELSSLKAELDKANQENAGLMAKNKELTAQLNIKAEETAKREQIYTVEAGETLFIIARKVLGNGYKYEDIARDNNIANPDIIITGQKLIIYY